MTREVIRVRNIIPSTGANGPGTRVLLHVQGCAGMPCSAVCFNPGSHPRNGGYVMTVPALVEELVSSAGTRRKWITISGGEPMQQRYLPHLLHGLRDAGFESIICYTGYTLQDGPPVLRDVVRGQLADVLVAGPYDPTKPHNSGLCSSHNQRLEFLTGFHSVHEFNQDLSVEYHYTPDGRLTLTGFPTEKQLAALQEAP